MRAFILLLALTVASVTALKGNPQRIVGGDEVTIAQYPNIVALLRSRDMSTYIQACGGVILNTRSVLTAAHCPSGDAVARWRVRAGSTTANAWGTVYNLDNYLIHPGYVWWTADNDIAILRTATTIQYQTNAIQPAVIAGSSYFLADNQEVWAAGWGHTYFEGCGSENLRHVQVWTVNQELCRTRYAQLGYTVTENMVCSGYLDVGGRDQCQGDSGGPLYHHGVVVGICSWGEECALSEYPGVNARVSRFTSWIQDNA